MPTSAVARNGRKGIPSGLIAPRPLASRPFGAGSVMKFGKFGLAKFGRLKMLKNSARSCRFTRSLIGVFFEIEKFSSWNDGPRSVLRPRSPKWREPARQLLSPDPPMLVVFPKVHGAWNDDRSTP